MTDEILDKTHLEFLKDRTIIIKGTIDDRLIEGAVMQIIKWNEEDDLIESDSKGYDRKECPIKIYIHSIGGIVTSSLALISAMATSKTPVYTYALGIVASAAFMIFVVGHKRFIQPYSILMYHDMTGGGIGKTQEREEDVIEQKKLVLIYQGILLKYTKITQKMLDKIHREKLDMHWLSTECIKLKIADEFY